MLHIKSVFYTTLRTQEHQSFLYEKLFVSLLLSLIFLLLSVPIDHSFYFFHFNTIKIICLNLFKNYAIYFYVFSCSLIRFILKSIKKSYHIKKHCLSYNIVEKN